MSQPYNETKELEMAITSAQKMVGSATMSMDPDQLEDATNAVLLAKRKFNHVQQSNRADQQIFVEESKKLINQINEQLIEAKK